MNSHNRFIIIDTTLTEKIPVINFYLFIISVNSWESF